MLLQATADDSEGLVVRSVLESLMELEREKPGSCEVLIKTLLQRLGRFNHLFFLIVDIIPGMIFLPSKMHQLLDETFHESLLLRCAAQKNLL